MDDFLREFPELRQFVLSGVQFTDYIIGNGAYGTVVEVDVPIRAAAKTLFPILQERVVQNGVDVTPKPVTGFVRECKIMSTLLHPNIVQFLGLHFVPDSRLPALVMERLLTSLHDLLIPEAQPPAGVPRPLSFLTIGLKTSILYDVASGLAYLHQRSSPIIHRDLSAKNILINSQLVAKISDLGVARMMPRITVPATMTKGPGASIYMPPEASAPAASNTDMSKYDASIDIFSVGVVTIFTIGETFPCDPLPPTYYNES